MPPDMDTNISDGLAYGYFGGFAAMFSTLIGASFSGMCEDVAEPAPTNPTPPKPPTQTAAKPAAKT
jgi:hypothetical protein